MCARARAEHGAVVRIRTLDELLFGRGHQWNGSSGDATRMMEPKHALLEGGAGIVLEERRRDREGGNDGDDERVVEVRRGKCHQRAVGVGYT